MITISIEEKNKQIFSALSMYFGTGRFDVSTSDVSEDCDFLLSPYKSQKRSDILLLHDFQNKPYVPADFITILNADESFLLAPGYKTLVVSYGLNPLATVTASSILEEKDALKFQCCIQRSIVSLKGKIYEPQEFPVCTMAPFPDLYVCLALVSLFLSLSFPLETFLHLPFRFRK